ASRRPAWAVPAHCPWSSTWRCAPGGTARASLRVTGRPVRIKCVRRSPLSPPRSGTRFAPRPAPDAKRRVKHPLSEANPARDAPVTVSDDRGTMRACVIRSTGGLERIEIADVAAPGSPALLGARDVRVAIRAAALNHLD